MEIQGEDNRELKKEKKKEKKRKTDSGREEVAWISCGQRCGEIFFIYSGLQPHTVLCGKCMYLRQGTKK